VLRGLDWMCTTEMSFNVSGERGSIDILAFEPRSTALLVIEVKSVIADVQATLSRLDRKVRLAPGLAVSQGWRPSSVNKLLVVRSGSTARRRIAEFEATFGTAFPDRAVSIRGWLRDPRARSLAGLWFVSLDTHTVIRRRSQPRRGNPPA
jgi:hypothetical protein